MKELKLLEVIEKGGNMLFIYPYKEGSRSVNALSKTLPAKNIKLEGSRFKGGEHKTVVNWGSSQVDNPQVLASKVINKPEFVSLASNKLSFFQTMNEYKVCPRWTPEPSQALSWIREGIIPVVARHALTGHSGAGIALIHSEEEFNALAPAPLYVQYVKKVDEYRVHVFMGEVIDIQRKARKLDVPDEQVNWQVRNHQNGFVYAREGVEDLPYKNRLEDVATLCIDKTGLDFGAVDIIYNANSDRLYALEINTAPGLEGTTLDKYVGAMRRL